MRSKFAGTSIGTKANKASKRRSHAVSNAVLSLEKRLLFTSIGTAESTYGNTSTTGVTLGGTGDPPLVVTAILEQPGTVIPVAGAGSSKTYAANKYTFFVNDGTGSAEIFSYTTSSSLTYIPATGDTISVTGTWSPFSQVPELGTITAISKTGTAAVPAPTVASISTLNPSDTITPYTSDPTEPYSVAGYPLTLQGVTISQAGTTFGSSSVSATITDGSGNQMVFFTSTSGSSAAYSDLVGMAVPTSPTNITGYVEVFKATNPTTTYTPEFYPIAVGAPVVSGLGITSGPLAGTNTITINGYGFTTASAVSFGGTPATSWTLSTTSTDQQITAVVPAGSAGPVDVTVTNANGTSATSSADQYTYTSGPAVFGISPAGGEVVGGTVVTITGTGFGPSDTVKFGAVAGTNVTYSAVNGTLTVTSPPQSAATVDITVSNGTQTSTLSPSDQFTYAPPPTVTGLYNASGGLTAANAETSGIDSGGDKVVIAGTNFSSLDTVKFGTASASGVTYNSSNSTITVVSPAGTAGTTVDVTVITPGGTPSAPTAADHFTYTLTTIAGTESPNLNNGAVFTIDTNPTITQILSIAGVTVSDINGDNETYNYTSFYIEDSTGSEDIFGSYDSSGSASLPGGYVPVTGNTISVTADEAAYQGTPELGGVTVISTTGTSSTYAPVVPLVETIPQVNTAAPLPTTIDGYIVTIKGVYISGLSIGGSPLTTFNLNNTSSGGIITDTAGNHMALQYSTTYDEAAVTEPSYAPFAGSVVGNLVGDPVPTGNLVDVTGWVDINNSSVTELNLIAITNPSTIAPVLTSSNPTQGPLGGNNTVTITGAGLTGTTSVSFGGTAGTNVTVVNDMTITVTAPAHAAGSVNLTVTNENGVSNVLPYLYTTAPVVSGVTPGGVSTTGANASGGVPSIVITGTGFTGATAVNFGTTTITSGFTVNSDTQITVTAAPAHAAAIVDVTVTAPASGGGSVTSSPGTGDKFIYDALASVTISPASGIDNGGTAVNISGGSLFGASAVFFGTVPATSFSYNSTNGILTAVSPAGTNGSVVDVKVVNYAGTSPVVATDKFTYTPTTVAAAQGLSLNTIVTIDSNPVISAILSYPGTVNGETYPYYAFLINDGTGSEDIFYNPTKQSAAVNAFIPAVGNTISVTGVIANFRQIDELGGSGNGVITAISNTGTAAVPAPIPETVSAVNIGTLPQGTGFGSHLITLTNATISGYTGTLNGTTNQAASGPNVMVNDSTGSMVLYYYTTSYATTNEQFAGGSFPSGPQTLTGFVYVFTSGSTNEAEFVPVLDVTEQPAWLAPSSQAIWNPSQKILYVNGASTIIADPGTDSPVISTVGTNTNAANSAAVLHIAYPNSGHQVHIGGLNLTDGASLVMNQSTGTPVVLLDANSTGSSTSIGIDAFSSIDLSNNFMDISNAGSALGAITTLVGNGYNNGTWTGIGITSSTAAHDTTYLHAVGVIENENSTGGQLYATFDGATANATDVLLRYTYVGDTNLDGKVDGSDYSNIDSAYSSGAGLSWFNGNFNYDTALDGSDYTLLDNVFNMQGSPLATPTAQIAGPGTKNTASPTIVPLSAVPADNLFGSKKVRHSLIDQVLEDLVTGK